MNFKSLIIKAANVVLITYSLITNANAGVISGDITKTYNGYSVTGDLQGLEWLSWDQTYGQSIQDIYSGYGDFIDDGWRYASQLEVTNLFTSVGLEKGWITSGKSPAASKWLWELFDYDDYVAQPNKDRINKIILDATEQSGVSTAFTSYKDYFSWTHIDYFGTYAYIAGDEKNFDSVHVLVRDVPEPSTFAMFSIALLVFGVRKLKK